MLQCISKETHFEGLKLFLFVTTLSSVPDQSGPPVSSPQTDWILHTELSAVEDRG